MKKVLNPLGSVTLALADIARILPVGLIWPMSWLVGSFLYYCHPKRRRQVKRAYDILRGVAGLKETSGRLTRQYFNRQFMLLTAQYLLLDVPEQRWQKMVETEGIEKIREGLDRGTGLVLTSFHFGAHLLVLNPLIRLGYTVVPVRPSYMQSIRSPRQMRMNLLNEHTIYVGEESGLGSPLRQCIRQLTSNAVLGVAYDGDQGGEPDYVPWFGGSFPLRRGAIELARLAKVPMTLGLVGIRNGKFVIRYHERWDGFTGEEDRPAGDDPLPETMGHFEQMVREFPECVWWTKPFCCAVGIKRDGKAKGEEGQKQDHDDD